MNVEAITRIQNNLKTLFSKRTHSNSSSFVSREEEKNLASQSKHTRPVVCPFLGIHHQLLRNLELIEDRQRPCTKCATLSRKMSEIKLYKSRGVPVSCLREDFLC